MKQESSFKSRSPRADLQDGGDANSPFAGGDRVVTWFAVLVLSCLSGVAIACAIYGLGASVAQSFLAYVVVSSVFFAGGLIAVFLTSVWEGT